MQNNNTINLLGIKGLKITNVVEEIGKIQIWVKLNKKLKQCPNCKSKNLKIHDYRTHKIKDMPIRKKETIILLNKTRYKCKCCGKKSSLKLNFVSNKCRITNRLKFEVLKEFKNMKDMTLISKEFFISSTTVKNILKLIDVVPEKMGEVLNIDEFKGNSGSEKYQVILADSKEKKVLDILASRKLEDLNKYFKKKEKEEKENVKIFVSDMWETYRTLKKIHFREATHVIDKYHFVRQVVWAVDNVRKNFQNSLNKQQRVHFKRNRKLILKSQEYLSSDEKIHLSNMLNRSEELREAYLVKESFFQHVMKQKERKDAQKALDGWIEYVKSTGRKEFRQCIVAFTNWREEILNSFEYKYTNGYVEGINNKIKTLKRISFCMKDFKSFRNRIMFLT